MCWKNKLHEKCIVRTITLLIIFLSLSNNSVFAENYGIFHKPKLSIGEVEMIISGNMEKSKIDLNKYNLDSASYNYIRQIWTFHYEGKVKMIGNEYLVILKDKDINDIRIMRGR